MKRLVERFICPGCVAGCNTSCGKYKEPNGYNGCESHVVGTIGIPYPGNFALGLPRGFNRTGWCPMKDKTHNKMVIRVWPDVSSTALLWDNLNVPVWAMEEDGFLFVRTYMPRTNNTAVDVVEGGTLEIVPGAINVGEFIDEID